MSAAPCLDKWYATSMSRKSQLDWSVRRTCYVWLNISHFSPVLPYLFTQFCWITSLWVFMAQNIRYLWLKAVYLCLSVYILTFASQKIVLRYSNVLIFCYIPMLEIHYTSKRQRDNYNNKCVQSTSIINNNLASLLLLLFVREWETSTEQEWGNGGLSEQDIPPVVHSAAAVSNIALLSASLLRLMTGKTSKSS